MEQPIGGRTMEGKMSIHGFGEAYWWLITVPKDKVTMKTHENYATKGYAKAAGNRYAKKMGIKLEE
jgi:hypothetical protein